MDFFFFVNESYGKCSSGNDNTMRMFGDSSLHSYTLRDDVDQVLLLDAGYRNLIFCCGFVSMAIN
jgi:hypothetical protein